jgi:4-amino-4-deoxy-L-arabinose transferase-like glycosyltransferase
MRAASINLGAVKFHRHAVPFYAAPQIDLSWWILPALTVLTVFILLSRKVFLQRSVSTFWLITISLLFFLTIGISVAMIDGYREGQLPAFLEPYTRTGLEYYGDVPKVHEVGIAYFLRNYAEPELFSTLSGHTRTHPPGGVLFLWIVSKIFGYNLLSASLASVGFTSLAVIPIYRLAKDLYGELVGRYALALFLITPNFVMFTTTSMDGPFSVFPILSVYLFYRAVFSEQTIFHAICTGIALAFGMLMTYSTVFMGVFFSVVGLLTLIANRRQFRATFTLLLIAGVSFATFYLLMFLLTGFNLPEALRASIKKDEAGMGTGYETLGRYLHLSAANLFAFLIGTGIPMTTVWIRQVVGTIRRARNGEGLDIYVIGSLISLLTIAFSTLYTMEVERIWIFMAPFMVIPVAKYLRDLCERKRSVSAFYWVAGLLCLQLILSEVTLYTYW